MHPRIFYHWYFFLNFLLSFTSFTLPSLTSSIHPTVHPSSRLSSFRLSALPSLGPLNRNYAPSSMFTIHMLNSITQTFLQTFFRTFRSSFQTVKPSHTGECNACQQKEKAEARRKGSRRRGERKRPGSLRCHVQGKRW
jgi:hypothetical protein